MNKPLVPKQVKPVPPLPLPSTAQPLVIEQEIPVLPGQVVATPVKVKLTLDQTLGWSKSTLVMHYYIEYKTNMISRNHLRNVLALLDKDISLEEVSNYLVKEAVRV